MNTFEVMKAQEGDKSMNTETKDNLLEQVKNILLKTKSTNMPEELLAEFIVNSVLVTLSDSDVQKQPKVVYRNNGSSSGSGCVY